MELFQSWSCWSKDAGHAPTVPPPRLVAEILDKAGVERGQSALDVGAGIGFLTIPAADRLRLKGKVIALEPAEDSRAEIRRSAQEWDLSNVIEIVAGRAEDLPLDDGTVDAVFTRSVLMYVEDKQKAIREFCRVLRRDGRLVCSEPLNRYDYLRRGGFYWSKHLAELGELGERIVGMMTECAQTYCKEMIDFTEQDLLEFCWKAGFKDVNVVSDRSVRLRRLNGENPMEEIGWDTRGSATQPTPHEYLAKHLSPMELRELCSFIDRVFKRADLSVVADGGRCMVRAVK